MSNSQRCAVRDFSVSMQHDNKQGSCGRSCKLESPGKRLLVLESFRNVLNASKKYEMYGRQ